MLNTVRWFTVNTLFQPVKRYDNLFSVGKYSILTVNRFTTFPYPKCFCDGRLGSFPNIIYVNIENACLFRLCLGHRPFHDSLIMTWRASDSLRKHKTEYHRYDTHSAVKKRKLELHSSEDLVTLKESRRNLKKELKLLALKEKEQLTKIDLNVDDTIINVRNKLLKIKNRFYIESIENAVVGFADQASFLKNISTMVNSVHESEAMVDDNDSSITNNSADIDVSRTLNKADINFCVAEIEKTLRESLINFSKLISPLNLERFLSDGANLVVKHDDDDGVNTIGNESLHNKHGSANKKFDKDSYERDKYRQIRDSELTVRGHGFFDEPYDPKEKLFVFKVMSYNVLSQTLLEDNMWLYKEHNPAYLDWKYRSDLLMKELLHQNADILCLQEVEEKHKVPFFDKLEENGYKGIYKKRTNDKVDGCAIYYNTSKFVLVEYRTVEFFQPGISILDRDNIGIVAKLHPVGYPYRPIVVATTHLLYNPRRHDIKLAQMVVLLAEIERIAYYKKNALFLYHPVILTGDFNLEPHSSVYKFLIDGFLQYEELDRNTLMFAGRKPPSDYYNSPKRVARPMGKQLLPPSLGITDNCQHFGVLGARDVGFSKKMEVQDVLIGIYNSDIKNMPEPLPDHVNKTGLFETGTIRNPFFEFASVYYHENAENETEATTRHNEYITVDYMLYTPLVNKRYQHRQLQLMRRDRLPVYQEWLTFIKNIPNKYCPSDHLPLIATFFLRIPEKEKL